MPHSQILHFGALTLDLAQGRTFGAEGECDLRPKTFALLAHLARNPDRVLSKDELMAAVWPGVIVGDDSLSQCVHELRRALGPEGAALLRTVPRRGYMFAGAARPAAPGRATDEVPPGSLAVIPFAFQQPPSEPDRILMDGVAHDIITRLAQLRSFHVIGRGSSFALRHLVGDPALLRRMLKVAYVVTGQVEVAGDHIALRCELIDSADGSILWSGMSDILRSDLVMASTGPSDAIVATLAREVTLAERQRATAKPTAAADSWTAFHRGVDLIFHFDDAAMQTALGHFDDAIRFDPHSARAHAFASFCHYFFGLSGRSPHRHDAAAAALRSGHLAMQADEASPAAHWAIGRALWLNGDAEGGLHHCRHAVALCPSFPNAHYSIGFIEAHNGDPARALDHLARSEALSPFDPFLPAILITRAVAFQRLGDIDAAGQSAFRAAQQPNAYQSIVHHAALILAAAGRQADSHHLLDRLGRARPGYDPASLFQYLAQASGESRQTLHVGLRALGHQVSLP